MSRPVQLTAEEVRVLGSLVEKSQATPAYYPITLNSLVAACNQKSSREPVVEYSEDTVMYCLEKLKDKGLVSFVSGTGRVVKYGHRIGKMGLQMTPAQACVISLLMLRGPQTPGEIRSRAGRQFTFPSIEFVQETLTGMMNGEMKYVEVAPRRSGQTETRYRHLFIMYNDAHVNEPAVIRGPSIGGDVEVLKTAIADLQSQMDTLLAEVASLKDEVERMKGDLYS